MNIEGARGVYVHAMKSGFGAAASLAWSAATIAPANRDARALGELGGALGTALTEEALAILGAERGEVSSYGKGAMVGADQALERAAEIIHPLMGKAMRATLGRGSAIVPSTVKRAAPG